MPDPTATAAPWECGRCGELFADHEEAQGHADTCDRPTIRLEEDRAVTQPAENTSEPADVIFPWPQPVTFDFGRMVFEQIVTDEAERASMWPLRDLHVQMGQRVAQRAGYRFSGEVVVRRLPAGDGFRLYRLIVPVEPV